MAMAHTFTAAQASERTVSMKLQQEENDAKEPESRERKRLQNRVAQRTYRKNQKERLRLLEQAAEQAANKRDSSASTTGSCISTETQQNASIAQVSWLDTSNPYMHPGSHENWGSNFTLPPYFDGISTLETTPSNNCRSALHLAVSNGNTTLVTLLVEHGANIDQQDSDGQTVLHIAARLGSQPIVQILLDAMHAGTVDAKDHLGRTALFSAVQSENEAVVKLLLDASIDPNCPDTMGCVALHLAVEMGSKAITLLLLSYGANVNA